MGAFLRVVRGARGNSGATAMPTFGAADGPCRVSTTNSTFAPRLFHLGRCLIQSCHANGTRDAASASARNIKGPTGTGNVTNVGLAVAGPTCFPTETLSRIAVALLVQTVILRGGNRMANATGIRGPAERPAGEQDRALRELSPQDAAQS